MHGHQIAYIFRLLYEYSYLVLYPLVVIEGPIISLIAGFLASTKFLNPIYAYITIIAGNISGDILYYHAGKKWFKHSYRRLLRFFKISEKRLDSLEVALKANNAKYLFLGKLLHPISG